MIAAYVEKYDFIPGKRLSVATFEAKLAEAIDISSVYEATAHRRSAHYSCLLILGSFGEEGDALSTVLDACAEQGAGFLQAETPSNFETWEELIQPDRNEPELKELNETLQKFFTAKDWLKRAVE